MRVRSAHAREVERRLEVHQKKMLDDLGSGCAMDFPSYRQIVGRIEGINDALAISEDVDNEMTGEN